ncbi:hypothetical protein [Citrobacter portucalensis]|uniref:hypothetical protein n=1 Tax=Citrobacter portucalensis TaxID=1639133 RepID=UPI00313FF1E7
MSMNDTIESKKIVASIVGTREEVSAYIHQCYPDQIISVIVWSTDEVKEIAEKFDLSINDEEAKVVLGDIARNENHEYGENEQSAFSYILAVKGLSEE